MIDINSVRKGNLFIINHDIVRVSNIYINNIEFEKINDHTTIILNNLKNVVPIYLCISILSEFGFKRKNETMVYFHDEFNFPILHDKIDGKWIFTHLDIEIKDVAHLQNLVFYIYGKYLKL